MSLITECPNCNHEFKVRDRNAIKTNIKEAFRLYSEELMSLEEVGKNFGTSGVRVSQVFKEFDLPIRSRKEMGKHRLEGRKEAD